MKAGSIKISKLTPNDLSDSPEGFEKRYERRQRPQRIVARQPKLQPLENKSMDERMAEFGVEQ